MSAPVALINPKHIYGFQAQVCDNLSYVNEQNLIFLAGTVGVIYNVDHHTQRFIPNAGKGEPHLIFLSSNKQFLAVGERSSDPKKPHIGIGIYDLTTFKKVQTLTSLRLQRQLKQGSVKFHSGAFSNDGKFLIGQVGPPEWTLVYWNIENGKSLATISLASDLFLAPVYQVLFHPHDNNQVSVVGASGFSLLQFDENYTVKISISYRLEKESTNFWSHSWVSDNRTLIGADNGIVLLLEGSEMLHKFQIGLVPGENESFDLSRFDPEEELFNRDLELHAVTKLLTFSKGFICSCGGDVVYLFERYAGGKIFRQATAVKVPLDNAEILDQKPNSPNTISALSISPSEDVIAVSTTDKIVYTFSLTSVDLNKQMGAKFEQLTLKIHRAEAVDVDICLQKPIAVTCSHDGVVAVWNYVTNQQQLFQYFDEPIYSIALHPTGHYIAAGFKLNFRLMGLMIDEIRTVHEFSIKECSASNFSNSGHLIGAVNGSVIVVFSTITFDTIASFKGHVGKITAIEWSSDDLRIISCGVDGAIIEWDIYTHKRSNEVAIANCFSSSITASRDNFTSFAIGSDCVIREIAESQVLGEVDLMVNVLPTSVVALHCGKGIIVSSSKGHIWIVAIPFANQDDSWHDVPSICSNVTKLKVTKDDKWLMSVSADGSFCIWEITDRDGRPFQTEDELPFLEEILITRADLEEKNLTICELNQQLKTVKFEAAQERIEKEEEHLSQINQLTNDYNQIINNLNEKIQAQNDMHERICQFNEKTMLEMKDNANQTLKRIQQENDQKLLLEYQKTDEIQLANETLIADCQEKMAVIEEDKLKAIAKIKLKYENDYHNVKLELEEIKNRVKKTAVNCQKNLSQLEGEADEMIDQMRLFYEEQLVIEKQNVMKYKSEIGISQKKMIKMEKDIDDLKQKQEMEQQEKLRLQHIIEKLQLEVKFLKLEIENRDDLLKTKEMNLLKIKHKYYTLDENKISLEEKMKQLNNQISDQRNELTFQSKDIITKNLKAQTLKNTIAELTINNQNLKNRISALNKLTEIEKNKVKTWEKKWISISEDLLKCLIEVDKSTYFKNLVINVCRKHEIKNS